MPYNEILVNQIREIIARTEEEVEEKKMFGGLCFMVKNKMCVGVIKDSLMVRFNPQLFEEILEKENCRPMDFSGKSMKGFVFVDEEALESTKQLEFWINLALDYNPVAKASPKKRAR